MSDKEIIILTALISLLLTENLTSDELNTLGNFLMCIGQNIISGAFQKDLCENNNKYQPDLLD